MKKRIQSLNLIILIISTMFFVEKVYGYAEVGQAIQTAVQPTVTIEKETTSIETGVVNIENGTHNGLQSVFKLQTNGNDEDYDFILSSKILTTDGEISGYGNNGCILFGNISTLPTGSAVENAKIGGENNDNVIAFPTNITTTSPFTYNFIGNNAQYGSCYKILVNSGSEGTITQAIGGTPTANSFNITRDLAGTYRAVVTFTAISK